MGCLALHQYTSVDHKTSWISGRWAVIVSLVLSSITILIAPFFYIRYIQTKEHVWVTLLAVSAFVLVFSSIFMNFANVCIIHDAICHECMGISLMRAMSLADEWSLGAGFVSSATLLAIKH